MIVLVGAMKIYVATKKALRKKERWNETQFYHQKLVEKN
jgi:hypothetical protein